MAIYLNPETKEYPRHDGDIQLIDPTWEPGDELPKPWVQVTELPFPTINADEAAVESEPQQINGVWTMVWNIRPLTDEEIFKKEFEKQKAFKLKPQTLTTEE
jgi:hypothetical protein